MAFVSILILSGSLALACFIVGNLPLSFSFSKLRIAQLSTLGVGLLLGAALGIIIPEGVEAIFKASPEASQTIALALLSGFILMLLVEQVLIPSQESSTEYQLAPTSPSLSRSNSTVRRETNGHNDGLLGNPGVSPEAFRKARSITFGLVIHSLADGLALGASSFSSSISKRQSPNDAHHHPPAIPDAFLKTGMSEEFSNHQLTLIVFLALLIHKLPTALALSTSLLPLLPVRRIRLHIGIFALATPLGAILSFILLGLFDSNVMGKGDKSGLWAGIALTFSGGTFLYVATVLQPVRSQPDATSTSENGAGNHGHYHPGESELKELGPKTRVAIIILGMVIPVIVSSLIGHDH